MTEILDANAAVFPVVGGRRLHEHETAGRPVTIYEPESGKKRDTSEERSRPISVHQVYGTCFCIIDDLFVTAGHVLRQALEHEYCGVGFKAADRYQIVQFSEHELHEEIDVAVFRAGLNGQTVFPLEHELLPMLFPVNTAGFPYAMNIDVGSLTLRAFQGSIVSYARSRQFEGNPESYELSFTCPRGLSGAPLWKGIDTPTIAGVVVGNSVSEMIVHSEREVIKDGNEVVYEQTEAMHLGVAIRISEIRDAECGLLRDRQIRYT